MFQNGEYNVTNDDISNYILFKQLLSKNDSLVVKSIMTYPDEENPLLYVINFSDHWESIPSDKRCPHRLATGIGEFELKNLNDNFSFWLDNASKIVADIHSKVAVSEIERQFVDFWNLLSTNEDSRDIVMNSTRTLPLPPRGYELIQIDSLVLELDSIPHLITTQWHQNPPYNTYCPATSYCDTIQVPAGCVAIAGAQMLKFMHDTFGVPDTAPENASCTGYVLPTNIIQYYLDHNLPIPQTYTMTHSGFRSSAWYKMDNNNYSVIAAFVSHIGKLANLIYFDGGAAGSIQDLVTDVFPAYGIESEFGDYDEDVVEDLLAHGTPSIIGGTGHAFIIDRYKIGQVRYVFTFRKRQENPDGQPEEMRTITYTEPAMRWFGMNWGFTGIFNDSWFLTWGPWDCGQYSFYSPTNLTMVTFAQY